MEYLVFILFVGLLVPWIIAIGRDHPHHGAILALVLLLGWTGIGWGLALFWALRHEQKGRGSRNVELRVVHGGASEPEPRRRDAATR